MRLPARTGWDDGTPNVCFEAGLERQMFRSDGSMLDGEALERDSGVKEAGTMI